MLCLYYFVVWAQLRYQGVSALRKFGRKKCHLAVGSLDIWQLGYLYVEMCPEWPWNAGYDAPNLACVPGNAAHMSWLVPRSSFANFFSDSWRIFGYDKIFCAHMHTADATDCLQNQHSHLIDSLCTLLSAAKSPTNTIAARTMIFGHSGLSILRCGCGYFISPPCMHMQIRGTVGSLRSCKPCCNAY